jgi:hypothetical protein
MIYIEQKVRINLLLKKDLEKGFVYEVAAPNFNVAVWTGEKFRGPALVNGKMKFVEQQHYEDGLPFGVCSPIKKLSTVPLKAPFDGANLLIVFRSLSELLGIYSSQ